MKTEDGEKTVGRIKRNKEVDGLRKAMIENLSDHDNEKYWTVR